MPEPKDKAEVKERPKKPPGYRKFEKLLKKVVKAPPLRRQVGASRIREEDLRG
jgi:hypothetical protein